MARHMKPPWKEKSHFNIYKHFTFAESQKIMENGRLQFLKKTVKVQKRFEHAIENCQ